LGRWVESELETGGEEIFERGRSEGRRSFESGRIQSRLLKRKRKRWEKVGDRRGKGWPFGRRWRRGDSVRWKSGERRRKKKWSRIFESRKVRGELLPCRSEEKEREKERSGVYARERGREGRRGGRQR